MNDLATVRYAGFWPRLGALLVDVLVLAPFAALSLWALSQPRAVALAVGVPLAFLFAAYNIVFVGRWGMTVGKCVRRLKVVSLDGERAGYRRAFYRHAVDLALSVVSAALLVSALMSSEVPRFEPFTFDLKIELLGRSTGAASDVVGWLYAAWTLSELVVLLTNEKRRALHDYIAGTVVVRF